MPHELEGLAYEVFTGLDKTNTDDFTDWFHSLFYDYRLFQYLCCFVRWPFYLWANLVFIISFISAHLAKSFLLYFLLEKTPEIWPLSTKKAAINYD